MLHWIPAKQLLTYHQYHPAHRAGPCGPAVNVRLANATGTGELLADTIGLAELGLPDLQVMFSNRDPADVVRRLRTYVKSVSSASGSIARGSRRSRTSAGSERDAVRRSVAGAVTSERRAGGSSTHWALSNRLRAARLEDRRQRAAVDVARGDAPPRRCTCTPHDVLAQYRRDRFVRPTRTINGSSSSSTCTCSQPLKGSRRSSCRR